MERLTALDEIKSQLEAQEENYILLALGEALTLHNFHRTSGVESQGGKFSQMDYRPINQQEVYQYIKECTLRLRSYIHERPEWRSLSFKLLVSRFRELYQIGLLVEIENIVNDFIAFNGHTWPEGSKKIFDIINFDLKSQNDDHQLILEHLKIKLMPTDLRDRLRLIVTESPWFDPKAEYINGNLEDEGTRMAQTLAYECLNNYGELLKNLDILYKGFQQKGYLFGRILGAERKDPNSFFDTSLACISKIEIAELRFDVLCGFLAGHQKNHPEAVASFLSFLASSKETAPYILPLTKGIEINKTDLERILQALTQGFIDIEQCFLFTYGAPFNSLNPEVMNWFTGRLSLFRNQGLPIAFSILFQYAHSDPEKWKSCNNQLLNFIKTPGLLTTSKGDLAQLLYYFENAASVLLKENNSEEVAIAITKEIIEYINQDKEYTSFDSLFDNLLKQLFSDYATIVWPIISVHLETNYSFFLALTNDFNGNDNNFGPLFSIPNKILIQWASTSYEGKTLLAGHMPLVEPSPSGYQPYPLAVEFINLFGDIPEVQDELEANLHTFSWNGSPIMMYTIQKDILLNQFIDSPKPPLRLWARQTQRQLENIIEKEKIKSSQEEIGIY